MSLQFLAREHVLTIRGAFHGTFAVIPRVNHKSAVHVNRLMLVLAIEHDSTTKPSRRRLTRLMQHGVGPDGNHLPRCFKFRLFVAAKGHRTDTH